MNYLKDVSYVSKNCLDSLSIVSTNIVTQYIMFIVVNEETNTARIEIFVLNFRN